MLLSRIASLAGQRTFHSVSLARRSIIPLPGDSLDVSQRPFPFPSVRNAHAKSLIYGEDKREMGLMSPEELEKRLNRFKRLEKEARLCIKDCDESIETEHFDEELESARRSVETAGFVYSEILEELALTPKGVEILNEVRRTYAPALESLRQELSNISNVKQKS